LSPLNSCTPTKSNLYLANSLVAVVRELDLYGLSSIPCTEPRVPFPLLTLYQRFSPGLRHLFIFCNYASFYGEELLAPRPTPKLEDHPFSAVRDCLFNIFAATLHIAGRSSISNLRTCHVVVTGAHLSWLLIIIVSYFQVDILNISVQCQI
jgi:hypothetical protein